MYKNRSFWEAVGSISAMIIGSGIFALPYAVNVSGIFWGVVSAGLAFFAILSIHLAYGEIVANTDEHHRFPGYASIYLGKFFGRLSMFVQILGFNTVLLIEAVLGGIFLTVLFGNAGGIFAERIFWTCIFFWVAALILFFGNRSRIGMINFVLAVVFTLITSYISFLAISAGKIANLNLSGTDYFFSFGIFMFAATGLAAVADAEDKFSIPNPHWLKKAVILGTLLPLLLYILFTFGVLLVAGANVTQDAISGLMTSLGSGIVKLGAIVGFLAVFNCFLSLGYDLKKIYELDMKTNPLIARFLVLLVPILLFVSAKSDFVHLMSLVGGFFISFEGLLVLQMLKNIRKAKSSAISEYITFLSFSPIYRYFLIFLFSLSIAYQVVYQVW
jgi:amino acid permease